VSRYLGDDGLDGEEGTFAVCTFWLAHCRALPGEIDRRGRRDARQTPWRGLIASAAPLECYLMG
jgi:GH15 family glucan-1,4-alpha-glucosidase